MDSAPRGEERLKIPCCCDALSGGGGEGGGDVGDRGRLVIDLLCDAWLGQLGRRCIIRFLFWAGNGAGWVAARRERQMGCLRIRGFVIALKDFAEPSTPRSRQLKTGAIQATDRVRCQKSLTVLQKVIRLSMFDAILPRPCEC